MGMGSGNEKKLQVFVERASAVSRALRPVAMRHSVATGKVAQRRRNLIMRGKWWRVVVEVFYGQYFRVLVLVPLLIGSVVVGTVIFHFWYFLGLALMLLVVLLVKPMLLAVQFLRSLLLRISKMAGGPPLVRALETFDLSEMDAEYFLDSVMDDDGSEFPSDRDEEQASEHREQVTMMSARLK